MTKKLIYQLYLPQETSAHVVEVFDCYDSRYGNIFYQGKLMGSFYKESYDTVLKNHETVRKMEKAGLDLNLAKVAIYDLEPLGDYDSQMTVMDFESAVDYSYKELLKAFTEDFDNIEAAVVELKKTSRWYKFLSLEKF